MAGANANGNGTSSKGELYMREAKFPEDFEGVLECATKAFNTDPCFMYFGNVQELGPNGLLKPENEKGLKAFMSFIIRTCIDMKTIFTVIADPNSKAVNGGERIAAAIYWVPANQRIALYQLRRLTMGGLFDLLRNWGLGCVDVSPIFALRAAWVLMLLICVENHDAVPRQMSSCLPSCVQEA